MGCSKCEHSKHATLCPCHGCFNAEVDLHTRTKELLDSTLAQLHATQQERDKLEEKGGALTDIIHKLWLEVAAAHGCVAEARMREGEAVAKAAKASYYKAIIRAFVDYAGHKELWEGMSIRGKKQLEALLRIE